MGSQGSCQSLAATIREKIRTSPQYSAACCIYRNPPLWRQITEQAYAPALVSIGPLHHNDKRLLPMEAHKLAHLRSFLRHSSVNLDLSSYLRIVKDMETDIRECYAVPIHLSSDDFIQMVLVDSTFLIELFRRIFNPSLMENDDHIMYSRYFIIETVYRDIKLAENQLPLFVLIRLYRAAFKPDTNQSQVPCFTDLACEFLLVKKSKINVDGITNEARSCCHLLDLLRSHYKPSDLTTDHFGLC